MLTLPFVKYHGAGNDFVLVDSCRSVPASDLPGLARALCDRQHGVGADGLLLLWPSTVASYRMQIFNSDGSEPAMCGNGIRCLADYIFKREPALSEVAIETRHAVLKCRKVEGGIAVNMGAPAVLHWPLELEEKVIYVVDTGVPHAVVFVDDLDGMDLTEQGRQLRFHPRFAPHGVNVSFAKVTAEGSVALRTYERGVEAETLACGTGAAAAAFVAMKMKNLTPPISILTRSSEQMYLLFSENSMELIGSAQEVFEGAIPLKS
jgi:diaminopimelate epimerase